MPPPEGKQKLGQEFVELAANVDQPADKRVSAALVARRLIPWAALRAGVMIDFGHIRASRSAV
jgi:hypothetical protein